MARYSVATTKDHLSSLIDKAMAGEEVVITRYGKPVVEIRLIASDDEARTRRVRALERLTAVRKTLPAMDVSYLDLKRLDEEERGY